MTIQDEYILQTSGNRSYLSENVLQISDVTLQKVEDHVCNITQKSLNEEIFGWMKSQLTDDFYLYASPYLIKETLISLAIANFGDDLVRKAAIKD